MIVISNISLVLFIVALLAPAISGFRRNKLKTSVIIGWGLLFFTCLSVDALLPGLALGLYGPKAAGALSPETPSTVAALVLGWIHGLVLHFVGLLACWVVDAVRSLSLRKHSP